MTTAPGATLRVSDQDRDAVAAELRDHYAVGRLTLEELDERLGQTYRARTREDLAAVKADLPTTGRAVTPRTWHRRRAWAGYVRVNAICWSLWGIAAASTPTHALQNIWPLWVTVPWGIVLVKRTRHQH